jgi:NTE family protein
MATRNWIAPLGIAFAAAALTAQAAERDCPLAQTFGPPSPALDVAPGIRLGLALGSGGVHGLAHIGVLEEFDAAGVDVPVVAGTSVGALVGSLWASGMRAEAIEKLARDKRWDQLGDTSYASGLRDLRGELKPYLGTHPIESWPRRFAAVATDIDNGHKHVFMTGDGGLAVQASATVTLRSPLRVDGGNYVDGALVEPLPVRTARDLGANYVIAVDIAYRPYEAPVSGLLGNVYQSMHILVNSLAERDAQGADFVLRIDVHERMEKCGTQSLVAAGREVMHRAWPALALALRQRADRDR